MSSADLHPAHEFRRRRSTVQRLRLMQRAIVALVFAAGIGLVAPAGAQQAPGATYGPVRPADTLWDLALRFRGGAGVSAQQVMIAILRANPEAFREGNINALRTGVTLRVPSVGEMAGITQGEAVAEFNRHEVAWRNRRRNGTAAPAPAAAGAAAPARPSAPPPTPDRPAAAEPDLEEQLLAARSEVADMHERLAERDEAIEELLVQLAAIRRELRQAQGGAPAVSGAPAVGEGDESRDGMASRASWLPVSPLVLGSGLIVLLVLIVVVTLIRQRGERDEPYAEDLYEDGDEESYPEEAGEDEVEDLYPDPAEDPPGDDFEPEPRRAGRSAAPAVAAAAGAAAGFAAGEEDEEAEGQPEDESTDLPIGIDLEGEEGWDHEPEEEHASLSEPAGTDGAPEFGRHVEVGELDELELDVEPDPRSYPNLSEDLDDDSPDGGGPDRPRGRRRG